MCIWHRCGYTSRSLPDCLFALSLRLREFTDALVGCSSALVLVNGAVCLFAPVTNAHLPSQNPRCLFGAKFRLPRCRCLRFRDRSLNVLRSCGSEPRPQAVKTQLATRGALQERVLLWGCGQVGVVGIAPSGRGRFGPDTSAFPPYLISIGCLLVLLKLGKPVIGESIGVGFRTAAPITEATTRTRQVSDNPVNRAFGLSVRSTSTSKGLSHAFSIPLLLLGPASREQSTPIFR